MPLIWITWLRSSAIPLDGYGSKIRKVNRCRPTVSNGTMLATKQEFFFTKVSPVQSIFDIELLDFLLIRFPFNTTIYFFVKNYFFSECFYFSEYSIRMLLFVFWLRNTSSTKYVRNWGVVIQNVYRCVQRDRGITHT